MSEKYSYSLSRELMELLDGEFPVPPLMEAYRKVLRESSHEQKEKIDEEIFGTFGLRLALRILELEGKYRDRSAELIYLVVEQTGHLFCSIQQRLLEIGMLAVMNENKWKYKEVSYKRLAYEVSKCIVYEALKELLGKEVADKVPCRHFCLGFIRGICEGTGIGDSMTIQMPSRISDETGHCLFDIDYRFQEKGKASMKSAIAR